MVAGQGDGVDVVEAVDAQHLLDHIGFNLDDFGVDSESFHCLGSFAFNSLKIDRALIQQMEDEVNAELIVAVLRIAKRMGMKTIAEGVVTAVKDVGLKVPLVVRLEGTNVEKGKSIINESGLNVIAADDLDDAAQKIVAAVKEAE